MFDLIYWDFKSNPINMEQYKLFLTSYYGEEADERYARTMWYRQRGDYAVLLAIDDGKLLGQSSAYKVYAMISGRREELWWSVDTFVLPIARGKGIGKKLQKKLHEDFPNFSSAWYSKTNGSIKRKCGAHELLNIPFNYYPVSSYFSVIFRIFIKKILHKDLPIFSAILKNKYYNLNRFWRSTPNFIIKEVNLSDNLKKIVELANFSLEKKDFYIIRDYEYLSWKYLKNPTIGEYKTLFFYDAKQSDKLLGAIIFSMPFLKRVFSTQLKIFTVLDYFILTEETVTKSDALCSAIRYFCEHQIHVDGVLTLENFQYFPLLRYPWKGTPLLSTYAEINNFKTPYLSYSDQDMEQMIL